MAEVFFGTSQQSASAGNDENKDDRLKGTPDAAEPAGNRMRLATPEESVITKIITATQGSGMSDLFRDTEKEQMPGENWLSTTLLTSAVVIMIKSKRYSYAFSSLMFIVAAGLAAVINSHHSRSPGLSNCS